MGFDPLPFTALNVCRYAAYLAGVKNLKATSIPKYLNIIRVLHKEHGLPNPLEENWFLDMVIKGIKRTHGTQICRKLPITPDLLLQMKQAIDVDAPKYAAFWAACCVLFFGLLRKSNVLPPAKFDPTKHLSRSHVWSHHWGLHLEIPWTKTIQFKERKLQVPLPAAPTNPLCPTAAVINLFQKTPAATPSDPVICYMKEGVITPLTYNQFLTMLKDTLSRIGVNPTEYAGHSFRRGGATWALTNGLPGELIQILGDWKSDAYKQYFDIPLYIKAQQSKRLLTKT